MSSPFSWQLAAGSWQLPAGSRQGGSLPAATARRLLPAAC